MIAVVGGNADVDAAATVAVGSLESSAEMPSTPLWRNSAINLGTRFPPNGALRSGPAAAALA